MNREDVIEILKAKRNEIESLGVYNIGLFGSYARRENMPESDIDLIIDLDANRKSFDNFMNISMLLEDILNKKVDLLTRESIDTDFFNSIKNDIIYVR